MSSIAIYLQWKECGLNSPFFLALRLPHPQPLSRRERGVEVLKPFSRRERGVEFLNLLPEEEGS
jgi:hypothetical protein